MWCYVELSRQFSTKRFRIYKSGDQKDDEVICRPTPDGAYVDDVLRPVSWTAELKELKRRVMQALETGINMDEPSGIADSSRSNADVRVQIDRDTRESMPLLERAVKIPLRCNDGKTVLVHRESALMRMATKLKAKIPVSAVTESSSDSKGDRIFLILREGGGDFSGPTFEKV